MCAGWIAGRRLPIEQGAFRLMDFSNDRGMFFVEGNGYCIGAALFSPPTVSWRLPTGLGLDQMIIHFSCDSVFSMTAVDCTSFAEISHRLLSFLDRSLGCTGSVSSHNPSQPASTRYHKISTIIHRPSRSPKLHYSCPIGTLARYPPDSRDVGALAHRAMPLRRGSDRRDGTI